MTPDLPARFQPICILDRKLYSRLRQADTAAMTHAAAIIACWDAERERLGLPPVPRMPRSRGLTAYQMPPSRTAQQGPRSDGADIARSARFVLPETHPPRASAAGLFGVEA